MDTRKLENLEAFSKFFDFVSNPDEYRELIKEAVKAVKDFNEMTLVARGIRDVDSYRAGELAKLTKKEQDLQVKVAEIQSNLQFKSDRLKEQEEKVAQRTNDIALRMQEVSKIRGELEDVAAAKAELAAEKAAFEEDRKNFGVAKDAFDKKVAAFEQLVRG